MESRVAKRVELEASRIRAINANSHGSCLSLPVHFHFPLHFMQMQLPKLIWIERPDSPLVIALREKHFEVPKCIAKGCLFDFACMTGVACYPTADSYGELPKALEAVDEILVEFIYV